MDWTLSIDESGRFEGDVIDSSGERIAFVVGGALFPGVPASVSSRWKSQLANRCAAEGIDYPPHGSKLEPEKARRMVSAAADLLSEARGLWVFTTAPPVRAESFEEGMLRFVRMFGEHVDAAARLASALGSTRLHLLPAQRTLPPGKLAIATDTSTLGLEPVEVHDQRRLRVMAAAEVRRVFDALGREDDGLVGRYPTLGSIDVKTADWGGAHPGLFISDLGCNHVYRTLRDTPEQDGSEASPLRGSHGKTRVVVTALHGLRRVREIDRGLRDSPPDLLRAARAVTWLGGSAAGQSKGVSPFDVARRGTANLGEELWSAGCVALGAAKQNHEIDLAGQLAGTTSAALAAKTGAYDGAWLALQDGWSGDGPLAARIRRVVEAQDRELAAWLWRATLECANHRGDTRAAAAAFRTFESLFARGRSHALLAQNLRVQNLWVVAVQNSLPAPADELVQAHESLRAATGALLEANHEAVALLELATTESSPAAPAAMKLSVCEETLWKEIKGSAPAFREPNREIGERFGTVARSHAFLSEPDRALETAILARARFADSPASLEFNASVIARIELDRLRRATKAPAPTPLLLAALDLAGARKDLTPNALAERLRKGTGSARFIIDLILRRALWTREDSGARTDSWLNALAERGDGTLLALLASGELRTHPTELIARHAAELLCRSGKDTSARKWFDLGIEICSASEEGGTLRRIGEFTRLLRGNANGAHGPEGCVTNPVFEYR